MKPFRVIIIAFIFCFTTYQQVSGEPGDCCYAITFDRETGDPIHADLEKYYADMNHYCGGDCHITGPDGWGPKH